LWDKTSKIKKMKKLYTLSLVLFACVASFAQTFYSENIGTMAVSSPFPLVSAYTGYQNPAPITYAGTADVRGTLVSSGYSGASGGNNVFITNVVGKYFQIDGLDTSAYASADLQLSFGINSPLAASLIIEYSTNGSTWSPLTYTHPGSGWKLVSIGESSIPSSSTLSIRFSQPDPVVGQFRIDDVKLSNSSAACSLAFGAATTLCDAFTLGTDTYTATIPFTGGGTATYNLVASVGTIGGDNPSSMATGNIIVSGIQEGTALSLTATGGSCNLSANVNAATCAGLNALPFVETFNYTPGSALGSPKWSKENTGDDILVTSGNLSYSTLPEAGNSINFGGAGIDTFAAISPTTSGTVYYSYLLNIPSMAGVTNVNGGYISGFGDSTSALGATLWTKRVDDNSYNLGIEVRTADGVNTTFTTDAYTVGETVFVVVGYNYVDGTNNDTVSLWVNPAVGASQPGATITDSHAGNDLTEADNFFLRQDSTTETPAALQIDYLRIATTWAQVTDASLSVNDNNIAGLKMYPNPVSNGTLYISTTANTEKAIVIYDVLGKTVVNTKAVDAVNVSNLNTGVYIVKITEEGKTATRKLVIK
jgi:hypothetical protein